jgi:RecG-like helicase
MSTDLPPSQGQQPPPVKARKQITKKLSTGQKISLSTQDERTLRAVYEYLAGYASRRAIETSLEAKKSDVTRLHNALPPSSRLQIQLQTPRSYAMSQEHEKEGEDPEKAETNLLLDEYYQAKEELGKLEDKLKLHTAMDHKISFKDLDTVLKSLGPPFHRKQIEHMIWEVDENLDEMIDFDELQLTYYRNITDNTGSEPCFFFKILEVSGFRRIIHFLL